MIVDHPVQCVYQEKVNFFIVSVTQHLFHFCSGDDFKTLQGQDLRGEKEKEDNEQEVVSIHNQFFGEQLKINNS